MTVPEFAAAVAVYCARYQASVTSWVRSARRNARVGGHPRSAHLEGLGADVVYDQAVPEAERQAATAQLGLRLIIEGDHDHLQPLDWTP